MKGTVMAQKGSVCKKCSRDKFKNIYNDLIGHSIPSCVSCGGPPDKVKIRTVKPGIDGKAKAHDIYSDDNKKTLTNIADALGLLGRMNKEIEKGTYKAHRYDSKARQLYKFRAFCEEYKVRFIQRSRLPQGHDDYISPGGLRNKINCVKKLQEYFDPELDIRYIQKAEILTYYRSYVDKFTTRNLAVGELKTMLRFAFNELELLTHVPPFPKLRKARVKSEKEIPVAAVQAKIILNIKNKKYRDMWVVTAAMAKRPCEVRSYQVQDIDFENRTLSTSRHISKGMAGIGDTIIAGRKSIKSNEEMGVVIDPVDDFLISILSEYAADKGPNDFIFSGTRNPFVSEDALNAAWRASCKELQVTCRPYDGSKHATLTEVLRVTGDIAKTKNFSNHTNVTTLQRYAKTRPEDKRELLDTTRFRKI